MSDESRARMLSICSEAVDQIRHECDALLVQTSDVHDHTTELMGCGSALVSLLGEQAAHVSKAFTSNHSYNASSQVSPVKEELILKRLDDIISIAYSKFYAFVYKDLPMCWRQLYTDASILKFCFLLFVTIRPKEASTESTAPINGSVLTELVKVLDHALILAGAGGKKRGWKWINQAFELLQQLSAKEFSYAHRRLDETWSPAGQLMPHDYSSEDELQKGNLDGVDGDGSFSAHEPFTPPVKHPIQRVSAMPMEEFQEYLGNIANPKLGPEPMIISGMIDNWPARTTNRWDKPSYLLSQTFGGRRLVPVEIGRSYVDEGWGQRLITFGEFLQSYIDRPLTTDETTPAYDIDSHENVGYLAQHQLFTQLPALRRDIITPDLCYTSPPRHPIDPRIDQKELDEPQLNAWFGPPGTITPLHTDPYHNLLVQVVGRKYVRLYSPLETERMHARGKENGVDMDNTSLLDVGVLEDWDHVSEQGLEGSTREAFKNIPYLDCILAPGDTLYIPIGWWHYVRGLSVSFSVSFWWN